VPGNAGLRTEHPGRPRPPVSDDLKRRGLEELNNILESQDFRTSRRGQILLRYLVEHALNGSPDSFKERTIGIEVFARDPDYDTGQDAIVRVAANDIRKRLADHYEHRRAAGQMDGVQISIPHGSYVPEFRLPDPPVPVPPPVVDSPPPSTPIALVPQPPAPKRFLSAGLAIAGLFLALAACLILVVQNYALRSQIAPTGFHNELPWSLLVDGGKQMLVAVADSSFGFTQELLGREMSLTEYSSGTWMNALRLEHPAFTGMANFPATSVADVGVASRITAMLEKSGYATSVRSARSLQVADLKQPHPLVLLGSPYSNPWVGLLSDHLNFRIQYDSNLKRQVCINTSPHSGEQSVYITTARTGGTGIAYAVISLVPNLQHNAWVLILAGSNMEGTEAAGEFATDLPRLRETLQRISIDPKRKLEQLELLMQLQCMGTTSGRSEIIANRVTYAPGS
jgi:hypothetical protein